MTPTIRSGRCGTPAVALVGIRCDQRRRAEALERPFEKRPGIGMIIDDEDLLPAHRVG